jgi:hypothetical protein
MAGSQASLALTRWNSSGGYRGLWFGHVILNDVAEPEGHLEANVNASRHKQKCT